MLNSEETLAQKFVRKGFWIYFFTILTGPLSYLIKIIISNDLSVGEVGMIYGTISFVGLIAAFNDLGCTESLNYFLPKYIIKNEYGKVKSLLKITFIIQILTSISIASILFIFAPWLAEFYFHEPLVINILRISGLYFIGTNLVHIATVLFSVSQNTKLQKSADFVRYIATAIGSLILFLSSQGSIESYMWVWIGGISICFIYSFYFSYRYYYLIYFKGVKSEKDTTERHNFYKYSLATLFTANIGIMLSQVDMQMIIFQLGSEATGYYSNYLSLLNIPFIFISPLFTFLFPVISELHGRNDKIKMQMIYKEFSLYFSILGIWLSLFLYQFGEPLAILFFGEKFRTSGIILGYSAFFLTFLLLIQINFQFLAGTGKVGDRARIVAIILPINIILNYIFIQLYGVQGSALAVGLSWIPLWYLTFRATCIHNSGFNWLPILKNIGLAGIATIIVVVIATLLQLNDTSKFGAFFILLIAMIIYLAIFGIGNLSLIKNAWAVIKNNK